MNESKNTNDSKENESNTTKDNSAHAYSAVPHIQPASVRHKKLSQPKAFVKGNFQFVN